MSHEPRVCAALLALSSSACFPPGDGIAPEESGIYFPIGLALDQSGRFLLLANSDFDLQFNAGVVQSLDLQRLEEVTPRVCSADSDCSSEQRCDLEPTAENSGIPSHFCVGTSGEYAGRPCGPYGEASASARLASPGRCGYVDPEKPQGGGGSLFRDAVQVAAFAKDLVYKPRPPDAGAGSARVFVPVGGDATLHWMDVDDDGELDCGQGATNECDDAHRVGDDTEGESLYDQRMPTEPFGIAASPDGRVITVTHQTVGQVSAFVNPWDGPPRLASIETGLPSRPMNLATVPAAELLAEDDARPAPGFLTTFRNSPSVTLLRFYDDGYFSSAGEDARPYLATVGNVALRSNDPGDDSRGIAVDASKRQQAEAECADEPADTRVDCLRAAALEPLDVYVASRSPPSLLVGRTGVAQTATGGRDLPVFYDSVPLSFGPSRVVLGDVVTQDGSPARRVFVVCFDSRWIYVYDPEKRRIETQIETGRGPHAVVVDGPRGRAYVAHFSDSYLGVVSLDQRVPEQYGRLIATIGEPTPPRATK